MIERQANAMVFGPGGYRLKFRPQEMSIFREDEEERSAALANLINSGIPLEAAISILGFDMDEDTKVLIRKEIEAKEERRQQMTVRLSRGGNQAPPPGLEGRTDEGTEQPPQEKTALEIDLIKWRRKAIKSLKKGKGAEVTFDSSHIPPSLRGAIEGGLVGADADEVKILFGDALVWSDYP